MNRQLLTHASQSVLVVTLIATVLASAPLPAAETEPVPAATKERAVENLDARINNLQGAKNCISNARTKGDVTSCRSNLKIKQRELKKD